jgi:hypothetical protein
MNYIREAGPLIHSSFGNPSRSFLTHQIINRAPFHSLFCSSILYLLANLITLLFDPFFLILQCIILHHMPFIIEARIIKFDSGTDAESERMMEEVAIA